MQTFWLPLSLPQRPVVATVDTWAHTFPERRDIEHMHLVPSPHPRHVLGVAAQQDVGAAPRHVGGDGHRAAAPALRHNLRLALHILRLRIQQLVRDAYARSGAPMSMQGPAVLAKQPWQYASSTVLLLNHFVGCYPGLVLWAHHATNTAQAARVSHTRNHTCTWTYTSFKAA